MIPLSSRSALWFAALLGVPAAAWGQAPAPDSRPAYAFLRQAEDWSRFEVADPPADRFDPIKHVDLSRDGSAWIGFGGRFESRLESWRDFGFGGPPGSDADDSFVLSRAFVHADLHVGDRFRLFVEVKSAQATDRDLPGGRRTLDMDTLDLQQAFAEVVLPFAGGQLVLRPGRQELLFGAQRLVSPLPWGNTLRTWEGVTGEWRSGSWSVTGLATAFVPVDKTEFNEPNEDITLFGLYAKRTPAAGGHGLELYTLGNERPAVQINGTSGREERLTAGARVWGPLAGATDYEVEGAWQVGEVGESDVEAWFLATQAGWRPEGWAGSPRFWLGFDVASGDEEFGGDVGTFHQLFPLGHAYFGYIDAIGRQNIMDASLGAQWRLGSSTGAQLAFHAFRLMETADALYDAGGAPVRTGATSDDVGTEIDLTVDRRVGRHLEAYAGYSHFFAGDVLEQTGSAEDIDFVYVGLKYTF